MLYFNYRVFSCDKREYKHVQPQESKHDDTVDPKVQCV